MSNLNVTRFLGVRGTHLKGAPLVFFKENTYYFGENNFFYHSTKILTTQKILR
jgi:hypothetical protein